MSDIKQLINKVKNNQPIYVAAFGGDERALVDEAIANIRQVIIKDDMAQMNYQRLIVGEDDLSDVISSLNTVAFLAPMRLIEIHGAESLPSTMLPSFVDYINDPSPHSVLILLFNKVDKRSKFISLLSKKNFLHLYDTKHGHERESLLIKKAKEYGLTMSTQVANYLLLILGEDLLSAYEALKKISLDLSGDVSIDDIEDLVADSKNQDVFLLAKSIGQSNLEQSLLMLQNLRGGKENAIKFLGVVMWQLRIILSIKHWQEQGMDARSIQKEVSVFGTRYDWMASVARSKSKLFHVKRLTNLIDCDRRLKSQSVKEQFTLIERMIYQNCK